MIAGRTGKAASWRLRIVLWAQRLIVLAESIPAEPQKCSPGVEYPRGSLSLGYQRTHSFLMAVSTGIVGWRRTGLAWYVGLATRFGDR